MKLLPKFQIGDIVLYKEIKLIIEEVKWEIDHWEYNLISNRNLTGKIIGRHVSEKLLKRFVDGLE